MIVIKTNNSDEIINYLSKYFLLDNCFIDVTDIKEINEDFINENFQCKLFKNKYHVLSPLLVLTAFIDVIDYLYETFVFELIEEKNVLNINNVSKIFIQSGFLPIDVPLIKNYIDTYIEKYTKNDILNKDEYYIFSMFKDMGYLYEVDKYLFEPTDKMINALSDTKYAYQLIILKNNCDSSILSNRTYILSLYEILKLIDIHIFSYHQKQIND